VPGDKPGTSAGEPPYDDYGRLEAVVDASSGLGLGELVTDEGLISRILNHSTSSTSGASVTAAVYNQYQ
jgi:hypothetical protein